MIYTSIDNVQYGQKLGRNIYKENGGILLKKGVELTVGLITRLRNIGVSALYILDDRFQDIEETQDLVTEETRREAIQQLSVAMQCVQAGKDFNLQPISSVANTLVQEISQNKNILANLMDIRTKDNELFVHSLNTCMLSVVVGVKLELNQIQLVELAIGSLLHDIGKTLVSEDDDKNHPWVGFNTLRKKHDFNVLTAHIALQHHEHLDGSGYPRGVAGSEIPLSARIVGVTDYYDDLISYQKLPPFEACEYIMGYAGTRYDLEVVKHFLKSIAVYPTGSWVTLTTNEVGVVIAQHRGLPSRPIVRVLSSANHDDSSSFDHADIRDIDLSKEKTIFIKNIITE
ncbi:hypothetical protein BHU72_11680 [Desulfuribacillus stibiiarsenatis]|uniref:HD-GYP domain-containing protein n=1 Tax=Desulfuribacillus stibiiarsenatis TaxID=1390249 RepID=A0A1E5L7S7_9FIRM|nr:HD domain-containing phosphohydrolase [Desulfuribacillus stibiiarsenatis]OEH86191.1 hypothetical protein BHU72_11680 [Desulfuribacillus stibiiarsenatis]